MGSDVCLDCEVKKNMAWQAMIDADPDGHRKGKKRKRAPEGEGGDAAGD